MSMGGCLPIPQVPYLLLGLSAFRWAMVTMGHGAQGDSNRSNMVPHETTDVRCQMPESVRWKGLPPIVQKDVRHKTHPRGPSMEGMKPAPWGGAWLAVHRGDVQDLPCGILLVMIKD